MTKGETRQTGTELATWDVGTVTASIWKDEAGHHVVIYSSKATGEQIHRQALATEQAEAERKAEQEATRKEKAEKAKAKAKGAKEDDGTRKKTSKTGGGAPH